MCEIQLKIETLSETLLTTIKLISVALVAAQMRCIVCLAKKEKESNRSHADKHTELKMPGVTARNGISRHLARWLDATKVKSLYLPWLAPFSLSEILYVVVCVCVHSSDGIFVHYTHTHTRWPCDLWLLYLYNMGFIMVFNSIHIHSHCFIHKYLSGFNFRNTIPAFRYSSRQLVHMESQISCCKDRFGICDSTTWLLWYVFHSLVPKSVFIGFFFLLSLLRPLSWLDNRKKSTSQQREI